jgi:pyridoxal phosphate enzyme (YggS family)
VTALDEATVQALSQRLAGVRGRVQRAAERAGRDGRDVLVVAVSKLIEPGRVAALARAGQVDFGESRAQELREKVRLLGTDLRWHFVGRLQRNKVADVVGVVDLVHSVDRLELAEALSARARARGVTQRVLVQVNTGADPAKAGCAPRDAAGLVARVGELDGLVCAGLMTVPPLGTDPRPPFAALARLSRELRSRFPAATELSMGMSNDFEVAVEEGATIVRVGQALFGSRNKE